MPLHPRFFGRWRLKLNVLAGQRARGGFQRPVCVLFVWLAGFAELAAWLCVPLLALPVWALESPSPMSTEEQALLDAINRYRSAHGRASWQPEPALAAIARSHSRAMATEGQLSHAGFQRRAAGTGSDLCVENLLRGRVVPERAVQLWTQSPAHHDNLLEPAARHAGVGVVGPFVTLLACDAPPVRAGGRDNGAGSAGRR